MNHLSPGIRRHPGQLAVYKALLLGNLLVVPLTFCIVLSGWLAELPFAHFNVPAPSRLGVLIWYIGWITFFSPKPEKSPLTEYPG